MMSSRGVPDTHAEALAAFVELAAQARDGALAKATAEYREAQRSAEGASETLNALIALHDAHLEAIHTRETNLATANALLEARETDVAAMREDLAAREAKLVARTKEIEEFSAEVGRRDEVMMANWAKLESNAAQLATDTKSKTRQADAAAERIVNKATAEAAKISDAARAAAEVAGHALDAELAQRREAFEDEMRTRERALKGREDALAAAREEMRRAVAA